MTKKILLNLKNAIDRVLFYKKFRHALIFISYLGLVIGGYFATCVVLYRYPVPNFPYTRRVALALFASQMILCYLFRVNRGLWKYSSIADILAIAKVTVYSFAINSIYMRIAEIGLHGTLRFTIVNHMFFLISFSALRVIVRLYRNLDDSEETAGKERVVIIGAGDAGELTCRYITRERKSYRIVGLLDDDPGKKDRVIHGFQVLGPIRHLTKIIESKLVDQVIIAIPSAPPQVLRDIVKLCSEGGIPAKILPSLSKMFSDNPNFEIRNLKIQDLLARDIVSLDLSPIRNYYQGKRVLVTGAAGSIGEELVKQVATHHPQVVFLLDQAESPLYFLLRECETQFPDVRFVPLLCDITDTQALEHAFTQARPQIVLHAAAYKHVPLLEENIYQALHVNVQGTRNLAELSEKQGVERFIFISTDKAVNPVNILGVSKRVSELMCQTFQGASATKFIIVRFGNVLGSQGSVVPLFSKQIEQGGPITVTHPEIQRYFMLIPEAVQLTLLASALGKGGEIFVLDMGEQVKIVDLAHNMIRLLGLVPDRDIKVEFTGLRPGEKLYEELYDRSETIMKTPYPKINMAIGEVLSRNATLARIDACLEAAFRHEAREVLVKKLKELVPSYEPEPDARNAFFLRKTA